MNEIEQSVIDTVAEEAAIDKSDIKLDSNLYDLGIDSLSSLEILVSLESKYNIRIPQDRLKKINTIRDIIRLVSDELEKKGTGSTT